MDSNEGKEKNKNNQPIHAVHTKLDRRVEALGDGGHERDIALLHLDSHCTPQDMSHLLLGMTVPLELLQGRLLRNEFDLTSALSSVCSSGSHDGLSFDELRGPVLVRSVRLARCLQVRAPVQPPAVRRPQCRRGDRPFVASKDSTPTWISSFQSLMQCAMILPSCVSYKSNDVRTAKTLRSGLSTKCMLLPKEHVAPFMCYSTIALGS